MYSHKKITSLLLSITLTISSATSLIITDGVNAMVAISNWVDNTYDAPIAWLSGGSNLILWNYYDTINLAWWTNTLVAGNWDSSRYTSIYWGDGNDTITLWNNWQHIDIKNGADTLNVWSGKLSTWNDIAAWDWNKTISVWNNYCQISAGKNDNKITAWNVSSCYWKITSWNGNNNISFWNWYSEIWLWHWDNNITWLNWTIWYDALNIDWWNNIIKLWNSWDYINIWNAWWGWANSNNIQLWDMNTSNWVITAWNQDNTIVAGKNYNTITVWNWNNNISVWDSSASTWNTITTWNGNNTVSVYNYFDRISLGNWANNWIIKWFGNSVYCWNWDDKIFLPSNYSLYKFSFWYNNDFTVTSSAWLSNTFYSCNKIYFSDKSLNLNYSSKTTSPAAYNINGSCWSANSTEIATAPSTNLCWDWSTPTVSTTATWFSWSCVWSIAWTTASCSASKLQPINWTCGIAVWTGLIVNPVSNLCITWTPSTVNTTSTWYSWSCAGNSVWTNASCSYTLLETISSTWTTTSTGSNSTNSGTTSSTWSSSTGTTTIPDPTNTDPIITSTWITWESEYLSANVWYSVNDSTASWKKARFAGKWVTWFMQFWPYTDLITHNSNNTAIFRMKVGDNTLSRVVAVIDINNFNWTWVRVTKSIRWTDFTQSNTYQDFSIDFYRTDDGKIEFRVNTTWAWDIYTDNVTVTPYVDNSIQTTTWESEDLSTSIWDIVSDTSASKWLALAAKVWVNTAWTLQFGPYNNNLVNGKKYTAKFRIKTPTNTSTAPIWIVDVYDEKTWFRKLIEFKATDFDTANTYQDINIDFVKPNSNNIEFRVFFYGVQDVYVDKVDVVGVTNTPLSTYESENLFWITSEIITDLTASGWLARESKVWRDAAWTAQFWPYSSANLIDGNSYNAIFRIKTPSITSTNYIWLIDVFDLKTWFRKIKELKASDFKSANTYQEFSISFEKPANSSLEYRLMFYGEQDITIDNVRIENWDYLWLPVYESEELPSRVWRIVTDSNASNGKAIFFDKSLFTPHWMQFGPYNVAGVTVGANYNANFVLKTDDNTSTWIIAYINVYNSDKWVNILVPIKWTDFASAWAYQTFTMPFSMVDNTMMEFRVFPTGLSNLYTDKVYLTQ